MRILAEKVPGFRACFWRGMGFQIASLLIALLLIGSIPTHAFPVKGGQVPDRIILSEVDIKLKSGFAPPISKGRGGKKSTISLDKALALAEEEYGGKALSGKVSKESEQKVFRIKLLSRQGRISEVFVDAVSGRVYKK